MTITQDELKRMLDYDESTGEFRWIGRNCKLAGSKDSNGYLLIQVLGKKYAAHILAWLYVYGYFTKLLDHIIMIRDDNRIVNLREASRSLNALNSLKPKKNNKSGFLGVYLHNVNKVYCTRLKVNGISKFLGCYETPEEAREVYLKAKLPLI